MVDHGRVVGELDACGDHQQSADHGPDCRVIAELVEEIGPLWQGVTRRGLRPVAEAGRGRRRGKHRLVFVDRLLATLVHPSSWGHPDGVLACWFGVDRSTITRAVGGGCGPCSPSEGAVSPGGRGCGLWPRSSTISARAGRPASSTVPRSGSAARPPDAGPRRVYLRQEQAERRQVR